MSEEQIEILATGGILGGLFTVYALFLLVYYVLLVIAEWKIFTKAGEAGWKSLIPIYNLYVLYKIIGLSFWTWFVLPIFAAGFISGILSAVNSSLKTVADCITYAVTLIVTIKSVIALGNAFGKGTGFKVGLFFLPNIFTLILGFGSAEYVGPANKE